MILILLCLILISIHSVLAIETNEMDDCVYFSNAIALLEIEGHDKLNSLKSCCDFTGVKCENINNKNYITEM